MDHEMRRKDRMLPEQEALKLLGQGEYGILSTVGPDGFPYGVPLSYAFDGEKITFHCAAGVGHKLENLRFCEKACFTVVGETQVLPDKFATRYESVIVFGTVRPAANKLAGIEKIRAKYSPDYKEQGLKYAQAAAAKLDVYELQIEQITAKARR